MSLVGNHQTVSPRGKSPEKKKGSLVFLPSSSSSPTPTAAASSPASVFSLSSGSVPSLQLASPNLNGSSSGVSPISSGDRRRSCRFSQEFAYSVDLYRKIKEQQEKEEEQEKEDENSTEEDDIATPAKDKNYREILELKEKQIQNLTSVFLEQSKKLKSRHEKDVEILKENFSKEAVKQKEEIEKLKETLKAMEEEILNANNSTKVPVVNGTEKKSNLNVASASLSTTPLSENGHSPKAHRIFQEEAINNLKSEIFLEVKEEIKSELKQELKHIRSQMRDELKEVSGELTEVREELRSMKREELKELKELKALLIGREETKRQRVTGEELDVLGQEEGTGSATAEESKPLGGSKRTAANVKEGFELGLGLGMGVALSLGLSLTLSIAGSVLLKLTTQSNGG
eukprot:TRINITY_DN4425_c0_g1_i4.p1 TRINITY_DN4425_c0_g1~~TRINITY_DN4425_c0_g1_i4.p1  ORF type:complete len:401 (+),score=113.67 TRINITY_DN4425_c0_g1_i4:102-1304(+)